MKQENVQTTKDRPAGSASSQGTGAGAEKKAPQERGSGVQKARATGSSELVASGGKTSIADAVVAKIVGMAAREIGGVYTMGAGMARTFGSVRERLPGGGADLAQGVAVQVGEQQAAVDIDLVVEYGVSIPDLAHAVRDNVIGEVEHMCGLEVVEVNIAVDDIHVPGESDREDETESEQSRLR